MTAPSVTETDPARSLEPPREIAEPPKLPLLDAGAYEILGVIDANPPREVQTEGDGSFAFRDLTPRTYRVAARAGDASAGPVALQPTAPDPQQITAMVQPLPPAK